MEEKDRVLAEKDEALRKAAEDVSRLRQELADNSTAKSLAEGKASELSAEMSQAKKEIQHLSDKLSAKDEEMLRNAERLSEAEDAMAMLRVRFNQEVHTRVENSFKGHIKTYRFSSEFWNDVFLHLDRAFGMVSEAGPEADLELIKNKIRDTFYEPMLGKESSDEEEDEDQSQAEKKIAAQDLVILDEEDEGNERGNEDEGATGQDSVVADDGGHPS